MTSTDIAEIAIDALPVDWKLIYTSQLDALLEEGVSTTSADLGAYWLVLGQAARDLGTDLYDAAAVLHLVGVHPPGGATLWSRLRNGDFMQPGTNARKPAVTVERFRAFTTPRADLFEDTWRACHGDQPPHRADIAGAVRRLFAPPPAPAAAWENPARVRPAFPMEGRLDNTDAVALARRIWQNFNRFGGAGRRRFELVARDAGGMPEVFRCAEVPLPARPSDPELLHASEFFCAAIHERVADLTFFENNPQEDRHIHAARAVWPRVVARVADVEGISLPEAERRLRAAGVSEIIG